MISLKKESLEKEKALSDVPPSIKQEYKNSMMNAKTSN